MYIYQNGKLYIRTHVNKLTGVNIDSGEVLLISGTECEIESDYQILTDSEVKCRFNTATENYIFPIKTKVEVKTKVVEEVPVNEPIVKVKKPTGRPPSKR